MTVSSSTAPLPHRFDDLSSAGLRRAPHGDRAPATPPAPRVRFMRLLAASSLLTLTAVLVFVTIMTLAELGALAAVSFESSWKLTALR